MIEFDKDDLKKKRIIKIFINSAIEILKDKGIESITVRKVAKVSGYNPATIYNYFDNSRQLIFFASLDFMKEYFINISNIIDQNDNPYINYIKIWEIFCQFSYQNPKIYYSVFGENIDEKPEILINKYFKLFPEDFKYNPSEFLPVLTNSFSNAKISIPLKKCVDFNYLTKENAVKMDEINMFFYHGMLSLMYNGRVNYTVKEATDKTIEHIKSVFDNLQNNNIDLKNIDHI